MRTSFVTSLALATSMLLPTIALAIETGADASANIQVEVTNSNPIPGQRLPLVKKIEGMRATDTRAELNARASTTLRAELRDIRDDRMGSSTEDRPLKAIRKSMINDFKERRAEIKGRLKAEAAQGLNRIISIFSSMLENLSAIDVRVDAHIQTLEANGTTDTAQAKDASQKAKDAISTATKAIDDAHVSMQVAASSTSPKESLPGIRAAVKNAQNAVQSARQAIEVAVKSLRTLHIESSASTRATTSNNY